MFKNYLKIALRNLRKRKGYAFINIIGLAVGLTCCLFIALYVWDETQFDRFHEKRDRLYRLIFTYQEGGTPRAMSSTQGILAPTVAAEIPEVERAVRLDPVSMVLRHEDRQFQESNMFYADNEFFDVFTFPLVRGNPQTALQAPGGLVLTEQAARRYFGDEDPLGKSITANNKQTLTVTGLLQDVPRTSHLMFDGLVSMSTVEEDGPWWIFDNWVSMNFQTYVLLRSSNTPADVDTKLAALLDRHAQERFLSNEWTDTAVQLEPLSDIYLRSPYAGPGPRGSLTNLYVFATVGVFVLLIACINFMNLATARSTERAKEVGVRKAIGAARKGLVYQFLAESMVMTTLAALLALLLAEMTLPVYHTLSGKPLSGTILLRPQPILSLLGMALLVGLLAGSYPALVLSRFRPAAVLKGRGYPLLQGSRLRKALLVVQFGLSIALLAGTFIVYAQLGFMQSQRLGFEKANRLVVSFGGDATVLGQLDALKQQFAAHPEVLRVAASSTVPGRWISRGGGELDDRDGQRRLIGGQIYSVDYDFLDVYGFELVAGRGFSRAFSDEARGAILLNETALAAYGFGAPEEALGQHGSLWEQDVEVIGVVKDFHQYALHRPVDPLILRLHDTVLTQLSFHLDTANIRKTVNELEALWNQLVPTRPFTYGFLDEIYDAQYRTEEQFGRLFVVFAALVIGIAALGLFGLASFTTLQRTKEIGIRKVLGASVPEIVVLLSRDLVGLVLVAFVLATPTIYVIMNSWLDTFAYRVGISWEIFLMAGLTALVIAFMTVSYQSIRAASANPVDALRYE